jgi:integrase
MGQKKSAKGTVSISNADKRIRLRWRYQGERYSLNLTHYTRANLLEAKKVALMIETDLLSGAFDISLSKYTGEQRKAVKGAVRRALGQSFTKESESPLYAENFRVWAVSYKNISLDNNLHYSGIYRMLKRWGNISLDNVVRKLNSEDLAVFTYNERLRMLRQFFSWSTKQGFTAFNPVEDVRPRKGRVKTVIPKREPFNEEEIRAILAAFREDTFSKHPGFRHSLYYPFIYFMFATGVRNAEAIGLRVKDVDFEKGVITIREVLARATYKTHANARIRKETKNGKIRQLPIGQDLKVILLSQTTGKDEDDLVFTSPKGMAIDDRMFQNRVFKIVLKELKIRERDLYACRHTFGSRCIEAGLTPVMTAFLMGNNPETALRNYTHQMSLPNSLPKV